MPCLPPYQLVLHPSRTSLPFHPETLPLSFFPSFQARLRSPSRQTLLGYSGSWTKDPSTLSNKYFKVRTEKMN